MPITFSNSSVTSVDIGTKSDPAATSDTGTFSLIAFFKRLLQKLTAGLNIGGFTTSISSTVTRSVGGAAATGDYVGQSITPQSFANVVRSSGATGVIKNISIVDKLTTAAVDFEVWLYSATFTAPADNDAWTITDTDALKFLGVIKISSSGWVASAANKAYSDDSLGLPIKPAGTDLFYSIVARGTTPAWATGDLQLTLGILQD